MSVATRTELTAETFFAWEAEQVERHEFSYGEVFSMAGGTIEHALIGTNAAVALSNQLANELCTAFGPDLAVELDPQGRFCYPDATIVCGTVDQSEHGPAVPNPAVVVEVLSKTTAAYDRGGKTEAYRRLPSLLAIVYIESERQAMSALVRDEDRWMVADSDEAGRLELPIGAALTLEAVYRGVELGDAPLR